MSRSVVRMVALALLAALFAAPTAAWADQETVVSKDGVTWAGSLKAPLFDPAALWVPGDTRVATFQVGNRAADAADVAVVARADDLDELIARGDVDLAFRSGSGSWQPIAADGRAHPLTGLVLGAGENAEISVRAQFLATSPNRSQSRTLPLDFQVVLSRSASASPPDVGGHGLLPDTGGVDLRYLVLGLLLAGLGSLTILIAARRKEESDEQAHA